MSTTTVFKSYIIQSVGENPGTWGAPKLNQEFIEICDRNVGGFLTKSLSNSNVVLSSTESQYLILRLTGTLSASVQITTSAAGLTIVENLCTVGAFAVTFTNGVGSPATLPPNARSLVLTDATNAPRAFGEFPTGTRLAFQQTTPPVGWTKDATHNNKALRIVSGTASSGGSVPFTTAFASQTPTGTVGGTAITIAQMPLHGHPFQQSNFSGTSAGSSSGGLLSEQANQFTNAAYTGAPSGNNGEQIGGEGGGGTHTHSLTMDAVNFAVSYVDVILAQKD